MSPRIGRDSDSLVFEISKPLTRCSFMTVVGRISEVFKTTRPLYSFPGFPAVFTGGAGFKIL